MNIDEMPAGREMDALIMEKVFNSIRYITRDDGLEIGLVDNSIAMREWEKPVENKYRFEEDGTPRWEQGNGERWFTQKIPHYSTDIADAWKVAEKMRITVTPGIGHGWKTAWCNASGSGETNWVGLTNFKKWSKADTAPLAICRAALKAMGVQP